MCLISNSRLTMSYEKVHRRVYLAFMTYTECFIEIISYRRMVLKQQQRLRPQTDYLLNDQPSLGNLNCLFNYKRCRVSCRYPCIIFDVSGWLLHVLVGSMTVISTLSPFFVRINWCIHVYRGNGSIEQCRSELIVPYWQYILLPTVITSEERQFVSILNPSFPN